MPFGPLEVPAGCEQKRLLAAIAEAGVFGTTVEEVAAYLLTRAIDDLLRTVKLNDDA